MEDLNRRLRETLEEADRMRRELEALRSRQTESPRLTSSQQPHVLRGNDLLRAAQECESGSRDVKGAGSCRSH